MMIINKIPPGVQGELFRVHGDDNTEYLGQMNLTEFLSKFPIYYETPDIQNDSNMLCLKNKEKQILLKVNRDLLPAECFE